MTVERRDWVLESAGVPVPPRLFTGILETTDAARRLMRSSAFGDQDAEGIIIRALQPDPGIPRIAKFVRADFDQFRGAAANSPENVVLSR